MQPFNPAQSTINALRRRFPLPESSRERAVLVMLVGAALTLASAFDPARDAWDLATQQRAEGRLAAAVSTLPGKMKTVMSDGEVTTANARSSTSATASARPAGPPRAVGSYLFRDDSGWNRLALSRKIHIDGSTVPAALTVVWPQGRPEAARAVGEFWDQLWIAAGGLVLTILGLIWYRRSPKPGELVD